jgi:hypothetical protein
MDLARSTLIIVLQFLAKICCDQKSYSIFVGKEIRSSKGNTYVVMKSGFKSVDSTGSSGPISSQKAQKIIVSTLYFDIWKPFNFHILLL